VDRRAFVAGTLGVLAEPGTGRAAWEKEYSGNGRWTESLGPYTPPTHRLVDLLMELIRQAVTSPELVQHLQGDVIR
jgi:hypothetical protein